MYTKKLLLGALNLGALAITTLVQAEQEAILMDEPDIYWTMGKLTAGGDAVLAETGEDVNGLPLDAVLQAEGDLPTVVDGIVPTSDDGAIMFDAAQGQSLSIADSPFTNDTPDNLGITNRTYELWFQPRNLPEVGEDNRQIIYMEGGTTRGLTIYLDGTQEGDPTEAELYIMTTNLAEEPWGGEPGPGATDPDFAVHTTVQKGQTYHLVYVIDKPDDVRENLNGDLIGYLNGQEFGRVDNKVGLWFDHTDDSGIGGRYAQTVFHDGIIAATVPSFYYFDGIVDEVAVYDGKSLTAEQIENHYLAGIGSDEVPIVDFTADAERIGSGDSLTLSWEVNAFDTLTINNGVGDVSGDTSDGKGSITVNPTETTTYVLSASKGEAEQNRSVSVFVGAPEVTKFAINGSEVIRAGASATLTWVVDGETSLTIEPDAGDVGGNNRVDVSPAETTTYTLTATNEFGTTTAEVTVMVTTDLIPDLGWSAIDLDGGEVLEWNPTHNNTDNDGILWEGGDGGTAESGVSNFANITAWVNSPGLRLTGNPNDSWQDGLGNAVTQANVSWELVFRPGDFEDKHTLFNTGGNGDGTAFVLEGSVLDFRFQDANNDDQRVIASTDLSEIGGPDDFYHVVGVADVDSENTGTASIYVNGELRGEPVTSAGTINDWDGGDLAELGTGNNIPGGNPFEPDPFTGDIALFNYYEGILLSEDQIGDLYRAQSGDTGFQITEFEVVAVDNAVQSVNLTWDSLSGRFYDVEVSPDLSSESWQAALSAIPAEPEPAVLTSASLDVSPEGSMQYFRVRAVGPPPFLETSFEDGMGEWTVSGDGTMWEFGAPTSGPGEANTGTAVAGTGLAGDYADGTVAQLRTPVIDPGETQSVKLEFWYYLEAAEGEGGQISVLEADGTLIANLDPPYIGGEEGNTTEWTEVSVRLPKLEPARPFIVQFALLSADDGDPENGTGWLIDDVRLGK